ncbi:UNKNOWN [Stylonychia lemnae]|uniref:Prohibitin n=1 Tax=Stylonychia lemnae TaxID=5949 RepID=A0A077ZTU8_STYLE|nr:UNKNOWN [Stylonychia lemnae]|eukprot:CDW72750.1 UNKNOWN [Stylonychia lemnae]
MNYKKQLSLGASALAPLFMLYFGYKYTIFHVDTGHGAIVFNKIYGVKNQVYKEGWHLMMPWFERPIVYDLQSRPLTLKSVTGSQDLQMVNISLRILYRPEKSRLPDLYRFLGTDYDQRVLPSIANEVLKAVVAQYNASQLLTKREDVSNFIRATLQERAKDFMIQVDDISIVELSFSQDYTRAVEEKQIAQQQAQRAQYMVMQAAQDKKSTIIKAQGEARAAELLGPAIGKSGAYIQIKRIEAARDIADALSKSRNRAFLDSDTLLLNLTSTLDSNLEKVGANPRELQDQTK